MKKISILIAFVFLGSAVSCGRSASENKKSATGKPYEVFVVMEDSLWNGLPGDTLRSFLWEAFPMLNQYEPFYTLYQSDPSKFTSILRLFRNVLVYRTDPALTEPSMRAEYDKWAEPQIVVYVTGPSDSVLVEYMDWNRDVLQGIFDLTEQDRFIARATRYADPAIRRKTEELFGLKINVPKGYQVAAQADDFLWLRYELPLVSQGIVIFSFPLTNRYAFTPDSLLARRNEFLARIPGPSQGSHMITSDVFVPDVTPTRINGRVWFRSQGFWDVKGDFMGGPLTSYATYNAATGQVIVIDTYVFSPKYDKRNYVRQLQSIVRTATVPGDTVGSVNWAKFDVTEKESE